MNNQTQIDAARPFPPVVSRVATDAPAAVSFDPEQLAGATIAQSSFWALCRYGSPAVEFLAPCPCCNGTGEAEYLTFDANDWRMLTCDICEGRCTMTLGEVDHHVSRNPEDMWMYDEVFAALEAELGA